MQNIRPSFLVCMHLLEFRGFHCSSVHWSRTSHWSSSLSRHTWSPGSTLTVALRTIVPLTQTRPSLSSSAAPCRDIPATVRHLSSRSPTFSATSGLPGFGLFAGPLVPLRLFRPVLDLDPPCRAVHCRAQPARADAQTRCLLSCRAARHRKMAFPPKARETLHISTGIL